MGCHPKPIDELHHFSRRLKPPTRNDPSFARSLSNWMKVLAAVDTFLPTSADLSSIFRGSKLCPNKWYKPFPNGWLIIVLAPWCWLNPCSWQFNPRKLRFFGLGTFGTEVWSSQLSINLQLFQSLHLRGTQGDPLGDPAKSPWRRFLQGVDGQWLPRRLFVSVVRNCFDWDLYVPFCTQSIPIWEYYVFCPQPSSTWGVSSIHLRPGHVGMCQSSTLAKSPAVKMRCWILNMEPQTMDLCT